MSAKNSDCPSTKLSSNQCLTALNLQKSRDCGQGEDNETGRGESIITANTNKHGDDELAQVLQDTGVVQWKEKTLAKAVLAPLLLGKKSLSGQQQNCIGNVDERSK